MDNVFLINAAI